MFEKFIIQPSKIKFVDNHKRDAEMYSKNDAVRYTATGYCHLVLRINGEDILESFQIKCFGRTKNEATESFHWQGRKLCTNYVMDLVNKKFNLTEEVQKVPCF